MCSLKFTKSLLPFAITFVIGLLVAGVFYGLTSNVELNNFDKTTSAFEKNSRAEKKRSHCNAYKSKYKRYKRTFKDARIAE